MKVFELPTPVGDPQSVAETMRSKAVRLGLSISQDGTLATLPGSVHLHLTKPGEKGTLEYTLSPRDGRAWFSYHENRFQPWITDALSSLLELEN